MMRKKILWGSVGLFVTLLAVLVSTVVFSLATGSTRTFIKPLPAPAITIIDHINLIDVQNRQIVRQQQLELRNGSIVAIRPAGTAVKEPQAHVIDGQNGYLTPGLIDMHVHLYDPAALLLSLSHGVTHVRVLSGVSQHLAWRQAIASNDLLGSSMTVSSPILEAANRAVSKSISNASQASSAVRSAHAQGYDLIKAYGDLSAESLRAIIAEASRLNIAVAKHGPHPSGDMPWHTLAGMQSLEHVEDIYHGPLQHTQDLQLLQHTIQALKQLNVPITPTLNAFWQLTRISAEKEHFLATQSMHYTSPLIAFEARQNQVKRWLQSSAEMAQYNENTLDFLLQITRQLHESGIPLLVGSDAGVLFAPHGLATHTEMQLLQQAGLDSFDVLKAATIMPAKALGMAQQIGQIRQGYAADFIYTRQNPVYQLAALREPDAVIKRGRWYTAEQLAELRQQAIAQRSIWAELWVILSNY